MAKRKDKFIPNVEISGIADKGKAVGRDKDGQVYFVEDAVPGDVVTVSYRRKKKGVPFGKMHVLETPSADRIEPFCDHFNVCGGCKWQHLSYEAQLRHKETYVQDAIRRIGKITPEKVIPILGAPKSQYYRNKLEFSFSEKRWITQEEVDTGAEIQQRKGLGFFKAGTFDKVVDIQTCYLQNEPSNAIRNFIRDYTIDKHTFYDARKNRGWLRNFIIRTNIDGQVMLIMVFKEEQEEERVALLDAILAQFPQIVSMYYVLNPKVNSTTIDLPYHHYYGEEVYEETLGDITYKIGPKSFFQTNPEQAKNLFDIVRSFADLQPTDNVYDLYTGLGSIALYVAQDCKQITGIETVEEAIHFAKINQVYNHIDNATFYAGDVGDILTEAFIEKHGSPDVIITDPPRVGMHKDVVQVLLQTGAKKIVYISCNPSTQARDLLALSEKYTLKKMQAVDMFPHTHHVENVALMELK